MLQLLINCLIIIIIIIIFKFASKCIVNAFPFCRIELNNDGTDTYITSLKDAIRPGFTRMVVCILSTQRADRYNALKVHLCITCPGN